MGKKVHRRPNGDIIGPLALLFAGTMASRFGQATGPGAPASRKETQQKRFFRTGELRLLLLKLIAESPRHGYELISEVGTLTGGHYVPSAGAIYPALQMLSDEGLVEEVGDDSPRKIFSITNQGEQELSAQEEALATLLDRLAEIEEDDSDNLARNPHLFRATSNLAHVLRQKAASSELDDRLTYEIVDMIDEMAKRIERL